MSIFYGTRQFGRKWLHTRTECPCEQSARKAREQQEAVDRTRRLLRRESGITGDWAEMRLGTLERRAELTEAAKIAKRYARDFPEVGDLIISGNPGVGKTHIAASIANALLERLVGVQMVTQASMLQRVKTSYDSETVSNPIPGLIQAPLLILDDLGCETGSRSDWVNGQLYTLIDARYVAGRPTIVTTNHRDVNALGAVIGMRVLDRLLHRGQWVDIDAESWRVLQFKARHGA